MVSRDPGAPSQPGTRSQLGSQTLKRGLEVLQVVVDAERALSVSEIAAAADLNRSVTYRLLRTLEDRGLVVQLETQGFQAGLGLLRLMPRMRQSMVDHARPVLSELARNVTATVVLTMRDRDSEVCLLCVQPPGDGPYITFREGAANPLGRGAASLAMLALGPERPGERAEVTDARGRGPFAVIRTSGELRPGTAGLAVAWTGRPDLALSVVFFDGTLDEKLASDHLVSAAGLLAQQAGF